MPGPKGFKSLMRRPMAIVLAVLLLSGAAVGALLLNMAKAGGIAESGDGDGAVALTSQQPMVPSSKLNGESAAAIAASEPPIFEVPKVDKISIDGSGDDWGERGLHIETLANTTGKVQARSDIDAVVRLGWNDRGLLALVTVHDDVPLEEGNPIGGDCVDLYLATKVGGTDMVRFAMGPGIDPNLPRPRTRAFDLRTDPKLKSSLPKISSQRQKIDGGYVIEALIPWSNLGLVKPAAGRELGFQVIVNDADGIGAGSKLAWFPSVHTAKDSTKMQRIRLVGPRATAPEVKVAAYGSYPRFHSTRVTVTSTDIAMAGKTVELSKLENGVRKVLAKAKLDKDFVRPELASAIIALPMAARGSGGYGLLDVSIDGKRMAIADLPDPGHVGKWLMPYQEFVFKPCVFSGRAFPDCDYDEPTYIEDLIGPYEVKVSYYDARYNPVTTADKPGRYGAIVEVRAEEDGTTYKYYCTLFREPKDFSWRNADMPITLNLPKEMGISAAAIKLQQRSVSNYFKDLMRDDGLNRDNETAVLLAGLYETHAATTNPASVSGPAEITTPTLRNTPDSMDRKWWAGLKAKLGDPVLPHLVYLPADYDKDASRHWPVLLCLHGKGERGDNLAQLKEVGLLGRLEYDAAFRKNFPFIVIAPQCRENDWWSSYELARLLDETEKKYRVDTDREYVTGMSMGGYGTWALANEFPDRFAAIAPVCGGGDPEEVQRLAHLPVWAFHGAKDSIVPFWESDRMVKALRALGDDVQFTVYPDTGHDAWTAAYANNDLYAWLLTHTRGANQAAEHRTLAAGATTQPAAQR